MQELTACAGVDVTDAMRAFIGRLMGSEDAGALRSSASDVTAAELAKLLFWLMCVGYSLRSLEVRLDMELPELPAPGKGGPQPPPLPPGR